MIINDCILDLENSMELEPDAATWIDQSRYKSNMTITAGTGGWIQLPSGLWVYNFTGDGYAKRVVANWRPNDYVGAIGVWFRTTTTGAWQTLFSSADEGSATRFIYFLISTSNTIRLTQRNNDTNDAIIGTTIVTDGKWHHVVFSSNGTAYSFFLDGAVEEFTVGGGTDSGDWFADTALRDNISMGVIEINSLLNYFTGAIGWTRVYSYPPTIGQIHNYYEKAKHLFGVA